MDVSPGVYKPFFDLLCRAISKKVDPKSKKNLPLKEIINAVEIVNNKQKNISENYLFAPFKYFVDLRTQANKGNTVTIQDFRLVKALEFISSTPFEKQYEGHEWNDEAHILIEQFEKSLPRQEKHPKKEFPEADLEDLFIKIIEEKPNVFVSTKITGLISKFFEAINEKRFHDAWGMLSTTLQKQSLWDGDFDLFKETSLFFKKIEVPPYYAVNFMYEYQTVKCKFGFTGHFNIVGSNKFQINYKNHYVEEFEKKKAISNDQRVRISSKVMGKEISAMYDVEIEDGLFQMLFFTIILKDRLQFWDSSSLGSERVNRDTLKHDYFNIDIVFRFLNEKWLIDQMDISDELYYLHISDDLFKI